LWDKKEKKKKKLITRRHSIFGLQRPAPEAAKRCAAKRTAWPLRGAPLGRFRPKIGAVNTAGEGVRWGVGARAADRAGTAPVLDRRAVAAAAATHVGSGPG
jgi:hypothetical protein